MLTYRNGPRAAVAVSVILFASSHAHVAAERSSPEQSTREQCAQLETWSRIPLTCIPHSQSKGRATSLSEAARKLVPASPSRKARPTDVSSGQAKACLPHCLCHQHSPPNIASRSHFDCKHASKFASCSGNPRPRDRRLLGLPVVVHPRNCHRGEILLPFTDLATSPPQPSYSRCSS